MRWIRRAVFDFHCRVFIPRFGNPHPRGLVPECEDIARRRSWRDDPFRCWFFTISRIIEWHVQSVKHALAEIAVLIQHNSSHLVPHSCNSRSVQASIAVFTLSTASGSKAMLFAKSAKFRVSTSPVFFLTLPRSMA